MLVIRELLAGTTRFYDLRRGNPKMSPALPSKRRRSAERAHVVRNTVVNGHSTYSLTPSGQDLAGVVDDFRDVRGDDLLDTRRSARKVPSADTATMR